MIEIMELSPGITLRCFRDKRFKQGRLSIQLVRPMDSREAAMNALLPAVYLRGSEKYPDLRAITNRLDTLYGASAITVVRRVGDYQTTGLYSGFLDDRFALPGEQSMIPVFEFLEELLLHPRMENGCFLAEYVESEKQNLIATIEAELNDKRSYAMGKLLRSMCRADSFGLPRMGEPEQVMAITPQTLTDHYRRILRESRIDLFYVGSAEPEQVMAWWAPVLGKLERDYRPLPPQQGLDASEAEHLTETMDVSQGKLCMGFTTSITNRSPEFPAMQIFNTVFGAGMTSKLFRTVREQLSLCYSVGSSYYGSKGIVTVYAGIDFDKEQLTREEVLRQLDKCCRGEITEEELSAAREAVLSSLRSTHDSPVAIESYYATSALSGVGMDTDTYARAVERVTMEQVVAAAKTVTPHATFFLKGGSQ